MDDGDTAKEVHVETDDATIGDRWDDEELALVSRVINSFCGYGVHHHRLITDSRRRAFFALPSRHQQILTGKPFNMLERFQKIENAIDTNADCARDIMRTGMQWTGLGRILEAMDEASTSNPFVIDPQTGLPAVPGLESSPSFLDFSKASSTIRHLYREWSSEGARERSICFDPLLQYLENYYSGIPREKRHQIKILNPGSGLGRFVFDLGCLGFEAEGIEISYHMVFGSMHLLNATQKAEQYRIYPFVLNGSNHLSEDNRLRQVMVPDIHPAAVQAAVSHLSEVPISQRLGISSGDFSVVFNTPENRGQYDVLATVFFLDTAKNPLAYMETAANCVKPGGLWMNLGPLKWHFENESDAASSDGPAEKNIEQDRGIGNPGAVELVEADILQLLSSFGFEIIHYEDSSARATGYIHDTKAMETNMFYASFWVARRLDI
ncbi:N2227-domain-containing protein [Microthyrium microscopicum]|uniref:carnosine N-methyltransferase n=1 Tax=Microthyrium microscopicum TaxID=703497 RepID=A0A6A6U1K0_9PEZI|nr:N2227-domain-containing protein [Microthyrium microscopicum]